MTKQSTSPSENEVVFVGIDVHKKTYAICATGEHLERSVKKGNLLASPKDLVERLKRDFKGCEIKTAYEAGFSGFGLHRELEAAGIANTVVHAANVPVEAGNRVKTDKRDAAKLAELLSRGALTPIHVPSVKEEEARLAHRTRSQLVEHRTALGNQIKSKLLQFGLLGPGDDRVMSQKLLESFLKLEMSPKLRSAICKLATAWFVMNDEVLALDIEITNSEVASSKEAEIVTSIPGIGKLSAEILLSEIGDVTRFSSAKKFGSYLGLTPSEYSSGEKQWRGRISRQGRAVFRSVLVQCAWRAIRKDAALQSTYQKIKARSGGKRAIVAIARRLGLIVRSCLLTGTAYAP